MEKEMLDKLKDLGVDRPIMSYRMIGNRRIEVHCLGDHIPTVYDLGEKPGAGRGQARDLESLNVAQLKKVAKKIGIKIAGLRKAEMIEAIVKAQDNDNQP